MDLSTHDRALLAGHEGPASKLAMDVITRVGEITGASQLVDVTRAHIDASFYSGQAHVDFARYLVNNKAQLRVPTWTNACAISLIDRDIRPGNAHPSLVSGSRELAQIYEALGCELVWTCAPYHLPNQPTLGEHIVVSESNAVIYYNSVTGARTNKYGDFLDVCAALVGRVPEYGMHKDGNRYGEHVFDMTSLSQNLVDLDVLYPVLGHFIGRNTESRIPVILGLPASTSNDRLRAIAASIGASGSVPMFHAVGVTPEAPDLETALGGQKPKQITNVDMPTIIAARQSLDSASSGPIEMIALGTPHFSLAEFETLVQLMGQRRTSPDTRVVITTSRHVKGLVEERGWMDILTHFGARVVVDTCTYFSPAISGCGKRVMTNSAKWAYYARGMLDVDVAYGSLEECVESAVRGTIWRDPGIWT